MSEPSAPRAPIGIFGGTFNPIHHGHLRSALELVERLQLARLYFMPSAIPPHRQLPHCSAEQRATMVALAVQAEPRLHCDRRELSRTGASFTVDSLQELRVEFGADISLCLIMGCDALLGIASWHRWQELLDYAHIVVMARPGWLLPESGVVAEWLQQHQLQHGDQLGQRPAGGILLEELRPLPISATEIRAQLRLGKSVRYLLPESVLDYINRQQLYICEDTVPDINQPHPG